MSQCAEYNEGGLGGLGGYAPDAAVSLFFSGTGAKSSDR